MGVYRNLQYLSFLCCLGLIGCAALDPCYYYTGRNDDKAIEICSNWIYYLNEQSWYFFKKKHDLAVSYNNRGVAYVNKDLIDLGLEDLNMATELQPDMALPYFNRGSAYFKLKKYDLAIAEYDKAIKFDSKFADQSKYRTFSRNDIARALMIELVKCDSRLHLAIIIGAINNVYSSSNIEQWKEGTKSILLSAQEQYYAEILKHDPKFRLITREKVESVLAELKFQNLGLTSTRVEFGQLIGATHLLVIDISRYSSDTSTKKFEDVVTYTLINIKSGRTIASQTIRTLGV